MPASVNPYANGYGGVTPGDVLATQESANKKYVAKGNGGNTNTVGAPSTQSKFVMTEGWYVALACIGGVMVADTRVGPIAFGILTTALIFQVTLLLQGK